MFPVSALNSFGDALCEETTYAFTGSLGELCGQDSASGNWEGGGVIERLQEAGK